MARMVSKALDGFFGGLGRGGCCMANSRSPSDVRADELCDDGCCGALEVQNPCQLDTCRVEVKGF